jgi:hypothetical protein
MVDDFSLAAQLSMCWAIAVAVVILCNGMQLLAQHLVAVLLLG